ncbi:hypothetical protein JCM14469_21990 [Desulfatiferula olefinivorans]
MKNSDEKERNERLDKLIRMLTECGTRLKNKALSELLEDDRCHNKHQSEDEYQKEQAAWLEAVRRRKPK